MRVMADYLQLELFWNATPPKAFVECISDAGGLEDVVHVKLDVSPRAGDGAIRHQLKQPPHRLSSFLQPSQQTETGRPVAQHLSRILCVTQCLRAHSTAASSSPATKCAITYPAWCAAV